MRFHIELSRCDLGVGCLRPQQFMSRIALEFPSVEFDSTSWLEEEFSLLAEYLLASDTSGKERDGTRWGIMEEWLERGPIYRFNVALPSGVQFSGGIDRSHAFMATNDRPSRDECDRIRKFFSSVTLGAPVYDES